MDHIVHRAGFMLALVGSSFCCACSSIDSDDGSAATRSLGRASIAHVEGSLEVQAPEGAWNGFQLTAAWDDWNQRFDGPVAEGTCSASVPVYDVYRRNETSRLPDVVRLGEPVPDFDTSACVLGSDANVDCESTAEVLGLDWASLSYAHLACDGSSGRFPVDRFDAMFYRVHPGAEAYFELTEEEQRTADYPVIDTAIASFRVEADGVTLSATSAWSRCDDALNNPCE